MIVALDYLVDRSHATRSPLAVCYVDLEKAFDSVPRSALFHVLSHHYGLSRDIVEVVRRMYVDACG